MLPAPTADSLTLATWTGAWARPADLPAQVTLAVAVALLVVALFPQGPARVAAMVDFSSVTDLKRPGRFLTVASFVAAFLSLSYIAVYLGGGPRDPLAPIYWLQGRALSHGELWWTASEPLVSFRAEHLLPALPDRVAGILPPGYPMLLAPGFVMGAPMVTGPLLAAALVAATWALGRELAAGCGEARAELVARVAVGLSVVSIGQRLYTADIVPFGATALAITVALTAALRARRLSAPRLFGLAGLAVGGLVAAHPLSAVAAGAIALSLAAGAPERGRALGWLLVAALPGALLLLAGNHAAVGDALASPAATYRGLVEPGSPASAQGRLVDALLRVRAHVTDVDNLEPLALLALVPLLGARRSGPVTLAALLVAGHLAVCAGAGSGDGPGALGGALPVEHALAALGLARMFPLALARAAIVTYAMALAGFAVHAAADHRRLSRSDLGRPHYEPDVTREANVSHGLLYFDDDQAFELAFDPGVPASHGVQAVRLRGDDHDRLLYDLLGHPAIHRYTAAAEGSSVVAWTPSSPGSDTWRFEAESDWPPLPAPGARLERTTGAPCASDGKVLAIAPTGGGAGQVMLELPLPRGPLGPGPRNLRVVPRVVQRGGAGAGKVTMAATADGPALLEWTWTDAAPAPTCLDLPPQAVDMPAEATHAWLRIDASGGPVAYDRTTVQTR